MQLLPRRSNHVLAEFWELLDMLLRFSHQSDSFMIPVQWGNIIHEKAVTSEVTGKGNEEKFNLYLD